MQSQIEEIVNISLKKALDYDVKGNIGQAYAHYTAVLEFCPPKRVELEKKFMRILCEWGIYLEQKGRIQDVIKCYQNSLELFPKNPTMLNNFAAHFLRNAEYLKAIKYLQKALELDKNYLPAVKNLQNVCCMAVDRWHFVMLNDKRRNEAFQQAIKKKVLLGYDTVLDIGTGTGLLSLYAHEAGAKEVYACEYSSVMCDITKNVFHKNKADNIKLISKISNDLKIPQDIPKRVALIVTEIFDAALFGELVIPTLVDAHKNLLLIDGKGIVVPMSATLYVAAVESKYIQSKSLVMFEKSNVLGSLNFENLLILSDEEFYDSENLQNVDLNYITESKPILQVDFNELDELENFMKDGVKEVILTKCKTNGMIHSLVAWFKLKLDENIELDSSKENSCWQFAVFPGLPQNVKLDDEIEFIAQIYRGRLKCSYKLKQENLDITNKLIYQLPKDIIMFLNDRDYVNTLILAAESKNKECIKTIYDTSPFPIYGLTILKENPYCEVLFYPTEDVALKHLIDQIVYRNKIKKKIQFVSDFSEIYSTLDNIFVHNFDVKGELIDWGQQTYREIFSCLLSSTGTLLPERIFLMGQLVYSEELLKMISVNDTNLQGVSKLSKDSEAAQFESCNEDDDYNSDDNKMIEKMTNFGIKTENCKYKIAEFINKYKINQVFDLNSTLYNCIPLSDVRILTELDESEFKEEIVNFDQFHPKNKKIIPNVLVCWYKICITDKLIIETRKDDSFMNHMAVVFENALQDTSNEGEGINIKVQQMRDLVKISVV